MRSYTFTDSEVSRSHVLKIAAENHAEVTVLLPLAPRSVEVWRLKQCPTYISNLEDLFGALEVRPSSAWVGRVAAGRLPVHNAPQCLQASLTTLYSRRNALIAGKIQ